MRHRRKNNHLGRKRACDHAFQHGNLAHYA